MQPSKREIELEIENCQLRAEVYQLSGLLLKYQTEENLNKYNAAVSLYASVIRKEEYASES